MHVRTDSDATAKMLCNFALLSARLGPEGAAVISCMLQHLRVADTLETVPVLGHALLPDKDRHDHVGIEDENGWRLIVRTVDGSAWTMQTKSVLVVDALREH
jgi:hypothetical protein